jgi:nitrite reductase/ring-hydroxylating ferredoxin subunit/uncharacterized membrane protein
MPSSPPIAAIERLEWLDAIAEPLQGAIREALHSKEIKNLLHGTWLHHPLHPALIDVPLGAWTLAAVLDGLELVRDDESVPNADFVIAVGLLGAAGAAVTGLADWSQTSGRARKVGVTHGILNVAATTLYGLSLLSRRRSRRRGIGLAMMAYPLAMSAAWLGGHLVYGEQVGVDHTATADQGSPEDFVDVLADHELAEGEPKKVMAGPVAVLLVRRNGTIRALTNTCTHAGGPLDEGTLEGDTIRCPWHGSRFCLDDGRVEEAPATFPARTFEVRVRDGRIEVRSARMS